MDVVARVPRLRARLGEAGCDALLVTNLVNIRYLTGFTGSAAYLLVLPDDLLFVTDGRYRDRSAEELAAALVDARDRLDAGGPVEHEREPVGHLLLVAGHQLDDSPPLDPGGQ